MKKTLATALIGISLVARAIDLTEVPRIGAWPAARGIINANATNLEAVVTSLQSRDITVVYSATNGTTLNIGVNGTYKYNVISMVTTQHCTNTVANPTNYPAFITLINVGVSNITMYGNTLGALDQLDLVSPNGTNWFVRNFQNN